MSVIQTIRKAVGLESTNLQVDTNNKNKKRAINWKSKSVFQTRKDIKSWKRAKQMALSAEMPSNAQLQLLYTDIVDDGMLDSQMGNRIGQLMAMPFVLQNAKGEVDEEQTKALIENPLYRTLTKEGLNSIYYGYSLIQFEYDEQGNLKAESLPRTNIVPKLGLFYEDYSDTAKGIEYRKLSEFGTWILEYNSGGLGVIDKTVPPVLFSRFATSCWSELCEIYGIPPRVLKTNTTDTQQMARAEQMMRDMGSAAWFIIDEEEEFSFADNVNTKGEVYDGLIRTCENRICLIISGSVIGQDTKNGNKGKEEVAQDILWYRIQDDMKLVTEQWNNINLPALVKHGIIKEGLKFSFPPAEDLAQLWTFVSQAMPYYDFDTEWLNQKFGIKVVPKQAQQTDPNTQKAQQKQGFSFFLKASENEANQTNCCGQAHISIKLSGSLNDSQLIERYYEAEGKRIFDESLFEYTTKNLTEAFSKGYKKGNKKKRKLSGIIPSPSERGQGGEVFLNALGITYGIDSPAALTAYEMNLFRFGGIKTLAESQLLNKAFRESKSFEDFRIRASLITKTHNVEWLRTEYNTAVAVGETSATYKRLINQTDLFPYWEYRTVDDNKVRPEHRLLDGLILPATHPLWQKIYPPNGWNCRCYIVPRTKNELGEQNIEDNITKFQEFVASEEFQKATKSGWGINRAVEEEVFTANQQYITNVTEADKLLSQLSPKDYKMKEPTPTTKIEEYADDKEQYWKTVIGESGTLNLLDYNKRTITITKEVWDNAIINEKVLSEIENVIQKPDEVWYKAEEKGNTFNQFMYVKYYQDSEPLAFIAELKDGNFIIRQLAKIADLALRWGLLIKN